MANAYKVKHVEMNGSGYFTALRATASTTLVKGIYFSHDDHNTVVTLALTKSGGSTIALCEVTHTADDMTQILPDTIALESGDQLEVKSTHISSSDVGHLTVNYVENTTSVSGQSIGVLTDVNIDTAPTNGQVLVWNDTADEFQPGDQSSGSGTVTSVGITAGTGISSTGGPVTTSGNITVALNADTHDLTDVTSTTPTTGQVLEYNGTNYTPSSKLKTLYDNLKTGSSTTINDGANTNSQVELTATTARLQTGVTEVKMTETSPGEIDFIVAAGASGSETAFTAVEINGTTTANNALFDVKTGTRLRIESSTNDLATIRNQASADTVIDLPTSTGTLALTSELYTDADADGQIAAASVTDLTDVTSAGSGAIITSAERTKLTGIATGATANDTDANLKNRANHTGTQTASTISDFNTQADARIAAANVTDLSDVTSAGSGSIITSAERTKLSGIATGAEVNVIDNVVDDTTPQLGGDLDTNRNNILFAKSGNTDFDSNGDIIKFGSGSTVQGELCYLTSSGTWVAADADATGTAGGVLLAIALGTDPDVDGMLLRGMFTLDHDPGTIGDELYVSTTAGDITSTAPSGTGDIVRVVGYCLDSTNGQIWFNPSNDFIELA